MVAEMVARGRVEARRVVYPDLIIGFRSRDVSRQPRDINEVLEMWKKLAFLFSLSAVIFTSSCASVED